MNEKTSIRLWDLPLRLFHWAVVLLIPAMWATAEGGKMRVHIVLGEVLLFLVAFRIVWGFVGSETARFASFVKGPAAVLAYLRSGCARHGGPVVGHNPLGAFSVLGLIGLLALQVGLGLFATDTDQTFSGPLNYWIGYDRAEQITHLHELVFWLIVAMVALHLAAIIFYAVVKKDRLVPAMVTGNKSYDRPVRQPRGAPLWRLALALALAGGLTWWAWNGGHLMPQPKPAFDTSYE